MGNIWITGKMTNKCITLTQTVTNVITGVDEAVGMLQHLRQ